MQKNTSWDKVAKWYDNLVADKNSYQQKIIFPKTLEILNLKKNDKVLDLGCGNGFLSFEMAKKCREVVAIDSSPNLISLAKRQYNNQENLKFFVGNVQNFLIIKDKFDVVVMSMMIENIEEPQKVIEQAAKVLNRNGRILISLNHPAFRIPRQSSWGWDEPKKMQYRRVDRYMSEMKIPIEMNPGKDKKKVTWTFHRPLQFYFNILSKNGLATTKFEELISHHNSQGGRAKAENRAREEFPLFIILLAIKV